MVGFLHITQDFGLVVGQEKDVSLFLDRTGEPATQQQVLSRLKNKDTSFSQPTTHPITGLLIYPTLLQHSQKQYQTIKAQNRKTFVLKVCSIRQASHQFFKWRPQIPISS